MRLIDADALLDDVMERYCKECDKRKGIKNGKYRIVYNVGDAPCRACSVDDMKDDLENAPTIEERRKGKWMPHPYGRAWDVCSECGTGCKHREYGITPDGLEYVEEWMYLYCPNCGADMRGEEDVH